MQQSYRKRIDLVPGRILNTLGLFFAKTASPEI